MTLHLSAVVVTPKRRPHPDGFSSESDRARDLPRRHEDVPPCLCGAVEMSQTRYSAMIVQLISPESLVRNTDPQVAVEPEGQQRAGGNPDEASARSAGRPFLPRPLPPHRWLHPCRHPRSRRRST